MSAWRREALGRFPEFRAEITQAASIFDVLSTLEQATRAVYRGENPDATLVERVFSFAAWGFDAARDASVQNAVAVGFYEHLPNTALGRADLARRLSYETLSDLGGLFLNMNTKQDFEALQREIEAVHGRALTVAGHTAS